jgi:hypothetical protein
VARPAVAVFRSYKTKFPALVTVGFNSAPVYPEGSVAETPPHDADTITLFVLANVPPVSCTTQLAVIGQSKFCVRGPWRVKSPISNE